MDIFEKSKSFIYKNARPLDLARWNFLFEQADRQPIISFLFAYQNPDGGFAHGLEPDSLNPQSTPLQTWVATKIIREINLEDSTHPLIEGILKYLASGEKFNGHLWDGLNTIKSNNNYPHAPWWSYSKTVESSYNPTASLAGFILKYADSNTPLYDQACTIAKEAYQNLQAKHPLDSMHEVACYIELYEYLRECNIHDLIDMGEFRALLQQQIEKILTKDTNTWNTDYVCKPSLFIRDKKSGFYLGNENICNFELDFIRRIQNADGTWNVTWNWDGYPAQWAISKNWWKSDIIIRNLSYLKAFES